MASGHHLLSQCPAQGQTLSLHSGGPQSMASADSKPTQQVAHAPPWVAKGSGQLNSSRAF